MRPKISNAPPHYQEHWQHAPRNSRLPLGYFDRPRYRGALVAAALLALLALLLSSVR